jgi:hypothetical protein
MSNRLALAALAAACIAAAAGGGYMATRQNAVSAPAAAQSPSAAVAAPDSDSTSPGAVQETEAVVGDNPKPATPGPQAKSGPKRPELSGRAVPPASSSRESRSQATGRHADASAPAQNQTSAPGVLSGTWPSSASQSPVPPGQTSAPATPDTGGGHVDDHPVQEPPRPLEPPKPTFDELVVARDSVIGLQLDSRVSSETARVEDRVEAHVSRDVKVGDRVAIPAGAHLVGSVTQVTPGGKFKEQARLGIRFHTLVLSDGTKLPISTETIVRVGDAPGNSSAAKIGGGAVGGAILGAILGGAKGAAIGATAGAGAGTAAVTASDRSNVVLAAGTPLTPRILSPVTVTVERDREERQ